MRKNERTTRKKKERNEKGLEKVKVGSQKSKKMNPKIEMRRRQKNLGDIRQNR